MGKERERCLKCSGFQFDRNSLHYDKANTFTHCECGLLIFLHCPMLLTTWVEYNRSCHSSSHLSSMYTLCVPCIVYGPTLKHTFPSLKQILSSPGKAKLALKTSGTTVTSSFLNEHVFLVDPGSTFAPARLRCLKCAVGIDAANSSSRKVAPIEKKQISP